LSVRDDLKHTQVRKKAMLGMWEIMAIGGVVVLLFGAKKLPALGGAVGESIKNFKRGINDIKTIDAENSEDSKTSSASESEAGKGNETADNTKNAQ